MMVRPWSPAWPLHGTIRLAWQLQAIAAVTLGRAGQPLASLLEGVAAVARTRELRFVEHDGSWPVVGGRLERREMAAFRTRDGGGWMRYDEAEGHGN